MLYLGFEVNASKLQKQYPMHPTPGSQKAFHAYITGLSPSVACRSRQFQFNMRRPARDRTTSPSCFQKGFSLPYSAFDRLYSPNHNCFLFWRVIRCFSSPHFRSGNPEQFGYPRVKGCLRLTRDYHSLPCPSSAHKPNHPLYG